MSSPNLNDSSEENHDNLKPDVDRQPAFEPKRIIHLSKPLTLSGKTGGWLGSIFRRKPTATPTEKTEAENTQATQTDPYSEAEGPTSTPTRGDRTIPDFSDKKINPGLRLRALLSGGKNPPPQIPVGESQPPSKQTSPRLVYLYIAVGLSLLVNTILVGALVVLSGRINSLKNNMNGLLSGLYGNFNGMDNASITTNITVDTQVPINFMLPIQQNTDVILTESLTIPHAEFVINSGGLSINAPASITLPAGTNLPVALNVAVPVQVTIPLTLQVPVNIPLAQTGLHQPLTGLQDTVRTYYCEIDKNAQYPEGIYLCKDNTNPTPTSIAP
jgi:hypothetical protein